MDTEKLFNSKFQELVCENLHVFNHLKMLSVKSSHFLCHSELLISGMRSVNLQFGNHLNIWQRNRVARGVSRKLLHWIEIMAVFSLENVTELIHHNFKEPWLLRRTGGRGGGTTRSAIHGLPPARPPQKKKKKKDPTLSRQS